MIVTDREYLRQVSEPVDMGVDNLAMIVMKLENELKHSPIPGVGLAAIQVGIPKQVAIMRMESVNVNIYNPEIVEVGGSIVSTEGCLSLPGRDGKCPQYPVQRYEEVTIKNGDGRILMFTEYEARVLQHELDHFAGVLVCDKEHRSLKIGRNEQCPCKSGKKYKRCHIDKQEELWGIITDGAAQ